MTQLLSHLLMSLLLLLLDELLLLLQEVKVWVVLVVQALVTSLPSSISVMIVLLLMLVELRISWLILLLWRVMMLLIVGLIRHLPVTSLRSSSALGLVLHLTVMIAPSAVLRGSSATILFLIAVWALLFLIGGRLLIVLWRGYLLRWFLHII